MWGSQRAGGKARGEDRVTISGVGIVVTIVVIVAVILVVLFVAGGIGIATRE